MRVIVLGANGMIGSAMFRVLSARLELRVWGTLRSDEYKSYFTSEININLISNIDACNPDSLIKLFAQIKPQVVINCIGLTKHHKESHDPLLSLSLNTILPLRLMDLCATAGCRFIHISTDCVFLGNKCNYTESDSPDSIDMYGKSKQLGEVMNSNSLTLRTSTIGRELKSNYGLLEWFLSQKNQCKGFSKAFFSGLPSNEFARVVADFVLPRNDLSGLFHVGSAPIDKHSLLKLIAKIYNISIDIVEDDSFSIDRSLNSTKFHLTTGYVPADWAVLIQSMYEFG